MALLMLVWGVASFAIVPPLQMRVMEKAGAAPNLASAMNTGAFNLGNAIGAAVGGGVIDAGLGYGAVPPAGAALAAAALLLMLWLRRGARDRVAAQAQPADRRAIPSDGGAVLRPGPCGKEGASLTSLLGWGVARDGCR